jgi:hypothetical protein
MATARKTKTKSKTKTTTQAASRKKTAAGKTADSRKPAAGKTAEIWRIKIQLERGIGADGPWEATVEMRPSTTLAVVHRTVQSLVGFADDHLYTFFVASSNMRRDRIALENEYQEPQLDLTLASIFPLAAGQKLFYWFDFGDDWHFAITRIADTPVPAQQGVKYPLTIAIKGKKPVQYPDFDE